MPRIEAGAASGISLMSNEKTLHADIPTFEFNSFNTSQRKELLQGAHAQGCVVVSAKEKRPTPGESGPQFSLDN